MIQVKPKLHFKTYLYLLELGHLMRHLPGASSALANPSALEQRQLNWSPHTGALYSEMSTKF